MTKPAKNESKTSEPEPVAHDLSVVPADRQSNTEQERSVRAGRARAVYGETDLTLAEQTRKHFVMRFEEEEFEFGRYLPRAP